MLWLALLSAAFLLILWAAWVEPRSYEVNAHAVTLRKPVSQKLRFLHLSDIHFSGYNAPLFRFFDRLAREGPYDFVFVSGDIIDCHEGIPYAAEYLRRLPSRYGTFAVLGNHDFYDYHLRDIFTGTLFGWKAPDRKQDVGRVVRELEEAGIKVLRNESQFLEAGGTPVWIHGLDDPTTGKSDVEKIRKNFDEKSVHFLLTHSVDSLLSLEPGRMDMCFSGHSHGGQIRFPWLGPVFIKTRMGRKFVDGVNDFKGTVCSISRGVHAGRGFWWRFLCPPEAKVIEVSGSGELFLVDFNDRKEKREDHGRDKDPHQPVDLHPA